MHPTNNNVIFCCSGLDVKKSEVLKKKTVERSV